MYRILLVIACVLLRGSSVAWAENETASDPIHLLRSRLATIMPASYMIQDCLPAVTLPLASTTLPAFPCQGVVMASGASIPVVQVAAAVGPFNAGDGTYWLALHPDRTSVVSGWNRQSGTHYLWVKSATRPALPGVALLAEITVSGGTIPAIGDWRVPASLVRSGTYDVTDSLYGGVADDTTDIGPALRLAVNAVVAQHGRIVRIPQGLYKLASAVTVPRGVEIAGDAWAAPDQTLTAPVFPRRGTWLHISSVAFQPFTINGAGTTIRDLAFDHDQPTPGAGWAPTAYPYVFEVGNIVDFGTGDVDFKNLFFLKATKGIHQQTHNTYPAGRINIYGLHGQVFDVGIFYEYNADLSRIEDVHFWPFWSQDATVTAYQESHMTALQLWRADGLQVRNFFAFAAYCGLCFLTNVNGAANTFQGVNIVFDKSRVGLYTNQNGTNGQIVNFVHNGGGLSAAMVPTSIGISLAGDYSKFEIVNTEISNVGTSCADAVNVGAQLTLTNFRCNVWNLAGGTAAGLASTNNAVITTSGLIQLTNGNGGVTFFGSFLTGTFPGGATFNLDGTFYAIMNGTAPTLNFAPGDYMQWIPALNAFAIGTDAGTYQTGGVKKYLCIQDGVLTVGTTCP
jgi:hypothetical protein